MKMSSIVIRSRVLSNKCRSNLFNRRFLSSGVDSSSSNAARETIIASQSILSDQSQTPRPHPDPEAAPQASGGKAWSFLKYGLIAVITGTAGYAGYLSYMCSYEEVDQKAKALRAAASFAPSEDASAVDKYRGLLYSPAMTGDDISLFLIAPFFVHSCNFLYLFLLSSKSTRILSGSQELVEENVSEFTEPTSDKLLPDLHPQEQHRERGWRTFKRPGVDAFLEHLAKYYEIVVYSDQMNMYVDPVCERLDPNHCIRYRLSRGDTKYQNGKHYRDLSKLNRDPAKILYVSAHAFESSLQPENCVPIKPFKLEGEDTTLLDLIPFLEYVARNSPPDIRQVLQSYERKDIAKEFLKRSKEYQRLSSFLPLHLSKSKNKGNNKVASGGDKGIFMYS
ncbi:Mitochondrial import inner membrane translocase subunit TIM50 [Hibiscus syriacus]|uniref:Mitochondrial import inner membrane translocase subunit TIM50 n=1 Tax=Hibiscus syriacus TaxID=106335 RepID=A0A6A2WKP1_HIBSY|nr:Mitochondrial import inner membrane translocase subunit TIM50 [Hibiscus syriacus]